MSAPLIAAVRLHFTSNTPADRGRELAEQVASRACYHLQIRLVGLPAPAAVQAFLERWLCGSPFSCGDLMLEVTEPEELPLFALLCEHVEQVGLPAGPRNRAIQPVLICPAELVPALVPPPPGMLRWVSLTGSTEEMIRQARRSLRLGWRDGLYVRTAPGAAAGQGSLLVALHALFGTLPFRCEDPDLEALRRALLAGEPLAQTSFPREELLFEEGQPLRLVPFGLKPHEQRNRRLVALAAETMGLALDAALGRIADAGR